MKLQLLKFCAVICVTWLFLGCGDGGSDLVDKVPTDPASVIKLDLMSNKIDLNTSADDSAQITITTRDSNNAALADMVVDLSATAGILTPARVTTSSNGTATFTFSPGPEKNNQVVIITASTGTTRKDIPITLSGSVITLSADKNSLLSGVQDSAALTVKAVDANNVPIANVNITLTSTMGNHLSAGDETGTSLTVKTGVGGTAAATLIALDTTGGDTITATGLGARADLSVNITNAEFGFTEPSKNTLVPVGTSTNLTMTWTDVDGNPVNDQLVTFTTTGGYFDEIPGRTSTSALTDGSGQATVRFTAGGIATPADITVTNGFESDTLRLLVAATDPSLLSLQAAPSVLRPSIGDVTSSSTITAIVRDSNGQPVRDKTVVFTLVNGPGGGEALSPGTAVSDSTGTASVTFNSGSMTSAQEGVTIRAVVQSIDDVYAETKLTIGNTATSIVIGTTNVVSIEFSGNPPLPVGYALPISVLVVDINGNPIPNATVNLGAHSRYFYTGYELDPYDILLSKPDGPNPVKTGQFINEDLNRNGFLDPGEDGGATGRYLGNNDAVWYGGSEGVPTDTTSGILNGRLDPGSVASIPRSVVTDSDGLAAFELKYAKSYGNWVDIEIIATTQVFGDLSVAKMIIPLKVLYLDVPYPDSPFGR